MDAAHKIAEAIKNSNLSYRELERITGLSKTTIKRYANCEIKKVSVDAAQKIAKATHTNARELLGWSTNSAESSQVDNALLDAISGLSDEQVKQALDYIDYLKSKGN